MKKFKKLKKLQECSKSSHHLGVIKENVKAYYEHTNCKNMDEICIKSFQKRKKLQKMIDI